MVTIQTSLKCIVQNATVAWLNRPSFHEMLAECPDESLVFATSQTMATEEGRGGVEHGLVGTRNGYPEMTQLQVVMGSREVFGCQPDVFFDPLIAHALAHGVSIIDELLASGKFDCRFH